MSRCSIVLNMMWLCDFSFIFWSIILGNYGKIIWHPTVFRCWTTFRNVFPTGIVTKRDFCITNIDAIVFYFYFLTPIFINAKQNWTEQVILNELLPIEFTRIITQCSANLCVSIINRLCLVFTIIFRIRHSDPLGQRGSEKYSYATTVVISFF